MGMTATQKLLAFRAGRPTVKAGELVRVPVNWTIASELALKGMLVTHRELGSPRPVLADRFFLSVDHTLSPFRSSLGDQHATGRELALVADRFAREYRLPYYRKANETILHTEPYERLFLPGDVVVGADSHSIMHGGLGTFAIGLGGGDVMLAAVLGALPLRVPEAVRIDIEGELPPLLVGKDLVLHILKTLRRNTVALERTVEYGGLGVRHLSVSDRGTICNMGAELGAATSFFPADEVTARFIAARAGEFSAGGRYFAADPDAPYVERRTIRIDPNLPPQVAVHPSPDNVYDITDPAVAGKPFDIAFVGSCTTTPQEFVLAGFMARAALAAGFKSVKPGTRKRFVAPSSMGIARMLAELGLIKPFESLGFRVGRAGCSFCLGVDGDGAQPGEWVAGSHNRTFPNRTGRGSFSMAMGAAAVVASSLEMRIRDPRGLMPHFDFDGYRRAVAAISGEGRPISEIRMTEPDVAAASAIAGDFDFSDLVKPTLIRGRVVRFGDNIDTDAIIPGAFCHLDDLGAIGQHAFQFHKAGDAPYGEGGFARLVAEMGRRIVVAGKGWGSGSSREHAVFALRGAGVQAVIAESIAYIHGQNLVSQAVPYRLIDPRDRDSFFAMLNAHPDVELVIELAANRVRLAEGKRSWRLLPLPANEQAVYALGGMPGAYRRFGERSLDAISILTHRFEGEV